MEELSSELLAFIFDFAPEDSLELRKVCDDWDFVITKYYNKIPITMIGTFKEILDIFYRSKLNVIGYIFTNYIRYIYSLDLYGCVIIKDVSALCNLHTLDIGWTDVDDVSALGNLHTLSIRCTGIEDVSALGNLHTLKLRGTNIKDFSALDNVPNYW